MITLCDISHQRRAQTNSVAAAYFVMPCAASNFCWHAVGLLHNLAKLRIPAQSAPAADLTAAPGARNNSQLPLCAEIRKRFLFRRKLPCIVPCGYFNSGSCSAIIRFSPAPPAGAIPLRRLVQASFHQAPHPHGTLSVICCAACCASAILSSASAPKLAPHSTTPIRHPDSDNPWRAPTLPCSKNANEHERQLKFLESMANALSHSF